MSRTKSLTLKIFSPNGLIHEMTDLSAINVPLVNGYPLGIHPGHAPLIAGTVQGAIRYRSNNQGNELGLHAGILSIRDNNVVIFTAGELGKDDQEQISTESIKYSRLMETLVNKMHSGEEKSTP